MDVGGVVPGGGEVFGARHVAADQKLQPIFQKPKFGNDTMRAVPDPQQVLQHYSCAAAASPAAFQDRIT